MRMFRRGGVAAVIALCLAVPASAAESPLDPLAPIAKHLQTGITSFLAGKPAAEAFAPWKVKESASAEVLRASLTTAKAASAKPAVVGMGMYFLKEGQTEVHMLVNVWLATSSPGVMGLERGLQIGDPQKDSSALDDFKGVAKPFATVATSLRPIFTGEAWKTLPWAAKADVESVLPEGGTRTSVLEGLAKGPRRAESFTEEIGRAAPDTLRLHLGDVQFAVFDADGKLVGTMFWQLEPDANDGLSLQPRRFRPTPAK